MPYTDTRIQPLILNLLSAIETKFKEGDIGLGWLGPQSGALTDLTPMGDGCTMGWVRTTSITPISSQNALAGQCFVRLSLDLEVGYATCYQINADGSPHTPDEDIEQMIEVTNAQMLLLEAILCGDWYPHPKNIDVITWTPAGPDGGAVGGAWQISVEIT